MGYANPIIRLGFPELTEDGDTEVHVIIKNPKLLPAAEMTPRDVPPLPDGSEDKAGIQAESNRILAGLVKAWHVFDATTEEQAPLDLPATPEKVAKLPFEITRRMMDCMTGAVSPS